MEHARSGRNLAQPPLRVKPREPQPPLLRRYLETSPEALVSREVMDRKLEERWGYSQRLMAAVAAVVLGLILVVLFGPQGDPEGEWYRRTGIEGPLEILDNIEVIPDTPIDEVSQEEFRQLAATTQGVDPQLTERILAENPDPRPLDQETGRGIPQDSRINRDGTSHSRQDDPQAQVRRSRAAQQSMQFVLLQSVNPTYPLQASASLRQRRIVVSVAMYVDESGHVAEAYLRGNNGGNLFAEAVLEAVRKWVYKPLLIDGMPSGFWDQINFVFTTGPPSPTASDQHPASGSP